MRTIISTIFINMFILSLLDIFIWVSDWKHMLYLNHYINNVTVKETKPITNIESSLINPPTLETDSYWNYVDTPFLEVDFNALLEQNPDTVGWIQVMGTNVDYPIVQTSDNDYYLTHSFDKETSKAGWIYSDFRNNLQQLNNNTIIYGHGRIDYSMFGSLRLLLEDDWYQDSNNYIIKISTPTDNMIWQIFSVYTIYKENYYITTHFENDKDYITFLDTIKNRSSYDFNTTLNINDKILTLSTCQDLSGQRIVVHAKLIKKETHSSL